MVCVCVSLACTRVGPRSAKWLLSCTCTPSISPCPAHCTLHPAGASPGACYAIVPLFFSVTLDTQGVAVGLGLVRPHPCSFGADMGRAIAFTCFVPGILVLVGRCIAPGFGVGTLPPPKMHTVTVWFGCERRFLWSSLARPTWARTQHWRCAAPSLAGSPWPSWTGLA